MPQTLRAVDRDSEVLSALKTCHSHCFGSGLTNKPGTEEHVAFITLLRVPNSLKMALHRNHDLQIILGIL